MPARQRLEALEQPFGQNLPMAMRETIRKDAEAELVEEEAIEFVDGLMDLSPSQAKNTAACDIQGQGTEAGS